MQQPERDRESSGQSTEAQVAQPDPVVEGEVDAAQEEPKPVASTSQPDANRRNWNTDAISPADKRLYITIAAAIVLITIVLLIVLS